MIVYVFRRLLALGPVLLGITLVVFLLSALIPGDPATAILGPYATPERVRALNDSLGLSGSLPERYATWLGNLLRGDLGHAYSIEKPVSDAVFERLGPTLLLAGSALFFGALLGLTVGTLSAVHQGKALDRMLTLCALAGISTPSFWLAMLFMFLFAVTLPLFPVSGMRSVTGTVGFQPFDVLRHLVLPAAALGLVAAGVISRLMRTAMLEVQSAEYIRLARAKGLPQSEVRYRHAFKAAFARIVPVIGLQAGFVLGGAVYIETVFQWPGLGKLLVDAIAERDLLLVQGGVVVVATLYVLVNLATDVVQRFVDPRVEA